MRVWRNRDHSTFVSFYCAHFNSFFFFLSPLFFSFSWHVRVGNGGGGGGGHVRKCPTFVPSIDNTSCSDFKSTRLSTETCVRGGR